MEPRDNLPADDHYLWRIWLYPLTVLTLLAGSLLFGRAWLGGANHYGFLVWNLLLAWIPYFCSLVADALDRRRPRAWGWLLLPTAAWLAFLPNAPYILTDFIHLRRVVPVSYAYDATLIGTFATTGCLLGIVSLQVMQNLMARHSSRLSGWLFAMTVLGLSGAGIYMGRVLRWNSWDLLTNPDDIADALLGAVVNPTGHRRAIALSIIVAVLLIGCYLLFTFLSSRVFPRGEQERLAAVRSAR